MIPLLHYLVFEFNHFIEFVSIFLIQFCLYIGEIIAERRRSSRLESYFTSISRTKTVIGTWVTLTACMYFVETTISTDS
ncbi:hypothetical protein DFH05DRAFT_1506838 [Lentinula detonsa]|uniref:Uncharacterized protein n=1 Tax=Lentinula detonsa TaxID=2804962 RepID=A0A9W8NTQ3_9AGAR|nr:hypothetical protein DFH05DRAFT_1506838 [Lentinula detonsa]